MVLIDCEELEMVIDISEGSSSGGDGGGLLAEPIRGVRSGSLPPFLTKLYDMVNNKATNSTISWVHNIDSSLSETQVHDGATSFAIKNKRDFINNLLPKMSKSNNFDSFISQLNNYGFKKISWDDHVYANEWFQEGKRNLLKNIKRSKQNKSEAEKLTFELKKLERESNEIDHELRMFKEYVDNTISNQKKIVQAMAREIKLTFGHHDRVHRRHMSYESENNNKTTQRFTLVGQHGPKAIQLNFSQSHVIEVEDDTPTDESKV